MEKELLGDMLFFIQSKANVMNMDNWDSLKDLIKKDIESIRKRFILDENMHIEYKPN